MLTLNKTYAAEKFPLFCPLSAPVSFSMFTIWLAASLVFFTYFKEESRKIFDFFYKVGSTNVKEIIFLSLAF